MEIKEKQMSDIAVGDSEFHEKTFSDSDICIFSDICGDKNPLHLDEKFAEKSIFKKRVVNGMLVATLISSVHRHQVAGEWYDLPEPKY